jgi:hypothetical protein
LSSRPALFIDEENHRMIEYDFSESQLCPEALVADETKRTDQNMVKLEEALSLLLEVTVGLRERKDDLLRIRREMEVLRARRALRALPGGAGSLKGGKLAK